MATKNPLLKREKNLKYTDMCIWIDENIHKPDCDMDRAYTYLYRLAHMLGCKEKYFGNKADDYDGYAQFLAYSTYKRLTDKSKKPMKSVLNYMKSIQYFRKVAYLREAYQKIIDPIYDEKFDSEMFTKKYKETISSNNHIITENIVKEIFDSIPKIISNQIPASYKTNKVLYHNIYMSCTLSMLDNITLPNKYQKVLDNKLKSSPKFSEVDFYSKHLEKNIILWKLDDKMEDIVRDIVNSVNSVLTEELSEIVNDSILSDEEFNNIISSVMGDGNSREND